LLLNTHALEADIAIAHAAMERARVGLQHLRKLATDGSDWKLSSPAAASSTNWTLKSPRSIHASALARQAMTNLIGEDRQPTLAVRGRRFTYADIGI
jgi:hypothetical protein